MNGIIFDEETYITTEQMSKMIKYYENFFYEYYRNEQIEGIIEDILKK